MAKMFPERPLKGTQSAAELKVFAALRDGLPDDYTVLHSVPIYRRGSKDGRLLDGEIDFLVIHPDKGLLVTEVKGGGIERVAETGEWFSVSFSGVRHEIKDPYAQAKTYCYAVLADLKNVPETRKFSYPAGHAVWFPDLELPGRNLGISRHLAALTLDSKDLESVESSMKRVFRSAVGSKPSRCPGGDGTRALREYFSPSTRILPRLANVLKEHEQEIMEATQSQYKVLSLLQRQRRALICGPAGSGKTFLALEKARRIVESHTDKRILMVCYNIRLAKHLTKLTKDLDRVDVCYFHQICEEFCRKAGIDLVPPQVTGSFDQYYMSELPEGFMKALGVVEDRYDALIVDEGQDFDSTWWIPLSEILRNPDKDIYYIFYDDNQILYDRNRSFPIEGPPFTLVENCRNTKPIHDEMIKFYQGDSVPVAIGPDGSAPEEIVLKSDQFEKPVVQKLITRLIAQEKIYPRDITILTPRNQQNSLWKHGDSVAGCRLDWSDDVFRDEKVLRCATIQSFKGLESPVVIVTETDKLFKGRREQLMYVANSRAKSLLISVTRPDSA